MRRIWIACVIAAGLGITACESAGNATSTVQDQSSVVRPKVATPGQRVPAAAIPRLTAIADQAITANGGKSVVWATVVVTTHAKALTSATPGDTEPSGQKVTVYLLTIRGKFVCNLCSGPSGSRVPTGNYVSIVMNAKTFTGTDFGLSPKPPTVSPASLGPVTYLHVHAKAGGN